MLWVLIPCFVKLLKKRLHTDQRLVLAQRNLPLLVWKVAGFLETSEEEERDEDLEHVRGGIPESFAGHQVEERLVVLALVDHVLAGSREAVGPIDLVEVKVGFVLHKVG